MPCVGERRRRWALGLLVGAIVAGVVLRAVVQLSSLGVPDGDEAVWGLMVRHAEHGQLTAFLWGQGYGGTLEVLLTTPLFAVFGTSMFLARLVPMALVAVACVLVSTAYDQRADGLNIPASFTPLVNDKRSLDRVFADYWVAYRLDFQTHERLIAAEALLPTLARHGNRVLPRVPVRANDNRHPAYDREVRASVDAVFVLVAGATEDERARPLLEHSGYRRTTVGGFAVYGKPPS